MTSWHYIGCDVKQVPIEILNSEAKLSRNEVKNLLETISPIEGDIQATNVDSMIRLLLSKGIYPLRIHPNKPNEDRILKLKKLVDNNNYKPIIHKPSLFDKIKSLFN